jgi:hypothetical protein
MTKLEAVNISFIPDHWRKIQTIAAEQGLSASAYVRQAVARALQAEAAKDRAQA